MQTSRLIAILNNDQVYVVKVKQKFKSLNMRYF